MEATLPGVRSDPTRGLIVGTAIGYSFGDVEPFLTSLRRSGYEGAVILILAHGVSDADREAFGSHGVTIHSVAGTPWIARSPRATAGVIRGALRTTVGRTALSTRLALMLQGPISRRWGLYSILIDAHADLFEQAPWIFLSDTRDVYVQGDFSEAFGRLSKGAPLNLFLEGAPGADARVPGSAVGALLIGDQPDNANWIRFLGGPTELEQRQVVCAGTILLTADVLPILSSRVIATLSTPHAHSAPGGLDQGAVNLLFHTGALDDLCPKAHANADGGVLTMGACPSDAYSFNDGEIGVSGVTPPVVHQYDRVPAIAPVWARAAGAIRVQPLRPSTPREHSPINSG